MIDWYFSAPKTLRRLRHGLSGPYIDTFAEALTRAGYAPATVVRYLRAAAHLGVFLTRKRQTFLGLDATAVRAFRRHLRRCHSSMKERLTPVGGELFVPSQSKPGPPGTPAAKRVVQGAVTPRAAGRDAFHLMAIGRTGEPVAPRIRSVRFRYRNS